MNRVLISWWLPLLRFRSLADTLLLAVAVLPAVMPLFSQGYLHGSDFMDPPWRAFMLSQAIESGDLFPRWVPDAFYRYGFPLFNFQGPLSAYQVLLLSSITGTDLIYASKTAFGINIYLAGIGAYLLTRSVLRNRGASLLAAVLYMYAPYTLLEVYERSSLAGSLGLVLLPFCLAAVEWLFARPSPRRAALTALTMAAMILNHNITAVIAFGMALVISAAHIRKRWQAGLLSWAVGTLALAVIATSFYWIPSITEMKYTHTEGLFRGWADYRMHFVDPFGDTREQHEEMESRYGFQSYRLTGPGPFDLHAAYPYGAPPFKLSLFQAGLMIFSSAAWMARRARGTETYLAILLIFFFLTTSWSQPVWDNIPPFIQFPWRLLGPIGLCLAVAGSKASISVFSCHRALLPTAGLAILTAVWLLPSSLLDFEYGKEINRETLLQYEVKEPSRFGTQSSAQFLPASILWADDTMEQRELPPLYDEAFPREEWVGETSFLPADSRAWILSTRRNQTWMQAVVEATEETVVSFHTVYYPGWVARIDNQQVPITASDWQEFTPGRKPEVARRAALGVAQVTVPPGTHVVTLAFEDTPTRLIAELLSAMGILVLAGLLLMQTVRGWLIHLSTPTLARQAAAVSVVTAVVLAVWTLTLKPTLPAWTEHRVVFDWTAATMSNVRLEVPDPGKADDYVHLRRFSIGDDNRQVLYMHPPSRVSKTLWVPEDSSLEFAIAVDPEVWSRAGDGVDFSIEARNGETAEVLFNAYVDPKNNSSQRRWIETSIDLSRFAHQEIELSLSTQPHLSGEYDWAGWATPRVVIR